MKLGKYILTIIILLIWCFSWGQGEDITSTGDQPRLDSLKIFCQGHFNAYNYFEALDCYLALLDRYEGEQDLTNYYKTKIKLAWVYYNLGYTQDALGLMQQIRDFFKGRDTEFYAQASLIHSWILMDLDDFQNAETIIGALKASTLRRTDKVSYLQYLLLSGRVKAHEGDSLLARDLLDEANSLCLELDSPQWYAYVQFYNGLHWEAKKDIRQARKSYLKASKVAKELGNAFLHKRSLDKLIPILGDRGNFEQAYRLQSERTRLTDSLNDLQRLQVVSKQIVKYESQKKQKEIIDLEGEKRMEELRSRRSNLANYALMISFLAVLAAAYLIITFYQQKLNSNQIITSQKEQINQQKINELKTNMQIESMQSMMKGQELERERVAKDLHDSLGGMLSAIKLRYDGLLKKDKVVNEEEFTNIHDLLDDACQEVRNISNNLQPGALEQLGLIEALNDLINKYQKGQKTVIHFQHYGILGKNKFDSFTSLNIYRIIQELLNNSMKHAKAGEILIQLHRDNGELVLMVEDDGVGYDTSTVEEGMGSENIRSRVTFLNAELNIDSQEGEGTSTMVTIPLSDDN